MYKKIQKRNSKLAAISSAFGMIGVPVMVAGTVFHRMGIIETPSLVDVMKVVTILGAVGFISGLVAMTYFLSGHLVKAKPIFAGLLLSFVLLLPLGISFVGSLQFPPLNDISTNSDSPPSIIIGPEQVADPTPSQLKFQKEWFPDIEHRIFFSAGLSELYEIAERTAKDMGMEIVFDRSKIQAEEVAWFQALAVSPVFGFRDDVSVRLHTVPEGVRVDVRSRSRYGLYDFGANAGRIEYFYSVLESNLNDHVAE